MSNKDVRGGQRMEQFFQQKIFNGSSWIIPAQIGILLQYHIKRI